MVQNMDVCSASLFKVLFLFGEFVNYVQIAAAMCAAVPLISSALLAATQCGNFPLPSFLFDSFRLLDTDL